MRKIIFAAVMALVLMTSCTDEDRARKVLEREGYTDIVCTGYDCFACGEDDAFSTAFTATNRNGVRIELVVCSGYLKGCTLRMK